MNIIIYTYVYITGTYEKQKVRKERDNAEELVYGS